MKKLLLLVLLVIPMLLLTACGDSKTPVTTTETTTEIIAVSPPYPSYIYLSSYDDYADLKEAVNTLSDDDFMLFSRYYTNHGDKFEGFNSRKDAENFLNLLAEVSYVFPMVAQDETIVSQKLMFSIYYGSITLSYTLDNGLSYSFFFSFEDLIELPQLPTNYGCVVYVDENGNPIEKEVNSNTSVDGNLQDYTTVLSNQKIGNYTMDFYKNEVKAWSDDWREITRVQLESRTEFDGFSVWVSIWLENGEDISTSTHMSELGLENLYFTPSDE